MRLLWPLMVIIVTASNPVIFRMTFMLQTYTIEINSTTSHRPIRTQTTVQYNDVRGEIKRSILIDSISLVWSGRRCHWTTSPGAKTVRRKEEVASEARVVRSFSACYTRSLGIWTHSRICLCSPAWGWRKASCRWTTFCCLRRDFLRGPSVLSPGWASWRGPLTIRI